MHICKRLANTAKYRNTANTFAVFWADDKGRFTSSNKFGYGSAGSQLVFTVNARLRRGRPWLGIGQATAPLESHRSACLGWRAWHPQHKERKKASMKCMSNYMCDISIKQLFTVTLLNRLCRNLCVYHGVSLSAKCSFTETGIERK